MRQMELARSRIALSCAPIALVFALGACDDSTAPPATDAGADVSAQPDAANIPDAPVADAPAADIASKADVKPPTYDMAPIPDVSGTPTHEFVADQIVLPTNGSQAQRFGHDYDNDGNPDNALGSILSTLGTVGGTSIQGSIDESVNKGDLLLLLRFFAANLNNEKLGVVNYFAGQKQTCCTAAANPTLCASQAKGTCFNGTASFTPATKGAALSGTITAGRFVFGPGQVKLDLPMAGSSLKLTLKQAYLKGTFSGSTITSGSISGGIDQTEIDGVIIPAVAVMINNTLTDPNTSSSTKTMLLGLFDTNKDNTITIAEVRNNVMVKASLAPDVDVDGDGKLDLSLGIGYTAVGAKIL